MTVKIDMARVRRVATAYHDAVAAAGPRGHKAVERLFEVMGECLVESAPDGLGEHLRRAINKEVDALTADRLASRTIRGVAVPWAVVFGVTAILLILAMR